MQGHAARITVLGHREGDMRAGEINKAPIEPLRLPDAGSVCNRNMTSGRRCGEQAAMSRRASSCASQRTIPGGAFGRRMFRVTPANLRIADVGV
jgi:hypothetical protein